MTLVSASANPTRMWAAVFDPVEVTWVAASDDLFPALLVDLDPPPWAMAYLRRTGFKVTCLLSRLGPCWVETSDLALWRDTGHVRVVD